MGAKSVIEQIPKNKVTIRVMIQRGYIKTGLETVQLREGVAEAVQPDHHRAVLFGF
ncbi:MAG: hypothetical protein ABSE06_17235 [Anaerolineaceae bacterium]